MTEFNKIPEINKQLGILGQSYLIVGVPTGDDFLQMIARVNETGMTIKPKNSEYLAVPNGHGGIYKMKEVTIPPRPFLRYSWDHYHEKWGKTATKLVMCIMFDDWTAKQALDELGTVMASDIRDVLKVWKTPSNAPLTIANKGKDDPLVDTGKLMNSITFKKVMKGE